MFDVIERLKSEWTDKYVVIDSPAPELARFAKTHGQVKTVNMNGRCLVEFDQFNNIGWYDIDPSALKIVPKPEPKPAEAKPAKSAAPAKAAAAKPAAKDAPAKPAGRPSTADILAAARGKGGPAAPAKPAGGRPSTAEILAAARGKAAPATKAPAAPPSEAEVPSAAEPAPAPEPVVKAKASKPVAAGPLPTTTAEKIAWCRSHDAKG
jgi:hypothetical protein